MTVNQASIVEEEGEEEGDSNVSFRAKGLRKLGVSEDDVATAERIFAEIPPPPHKSLKRSTKVEIILGYTKSRLRREKALKVLGANEEEVDLENAKILGSLGVSGRRRSYRIDNEEGSLLIRLQPKQRQQQQQQQGMRRRSTGSAVDIQRKQKAEIRKIRNEMNAQQNEIELLKDQLEHLQDELHHKNDMVVTEYNTTL